MEKNGQNQIPHHLNSSFILQLFLAACGSKHITDTVAQDKKDYDSIQAIKELDDISKQLGKSSEQPSRK